MKFKTALTALALGKEISPDFNKDIVVFSKDGNIKLRVGDSAHNLPTDIESLLVLLECDWNVC